MKGHREQTTGVGTYVVRCYSYGDFEVQAKTPAAAKYAVFKKAREAGLFDHRGGFRKFLSHGWQAREIRR